MIMRGIIYLYSLYVLVLPFQNCVIPQNCFFQILGFVLKWDVNKGIGTFGCVCGDNGRRDKVIGDIKYGTREQYIVGGGLGMSNIGMLMIIAKVRGTCDISFFMKICYLLSTLDSIIQNHIGHLMMLAQNISLYRSKRTDYCD